jgi:hypothetical protein
MRKKTVSQKFCATVPLRQVFGVLETANSKNIFG